MAYYDRYALLRDNKGDIKVIPFIRIPVNNTDIYIVFNRDQMRLDLLSYKYYGDPNYAWLIMQANPALGPYEYTWPNGARIRIPYPLNIAISGYENNIRTAISNQ